MQPSAILIVLRQFFAIGEPSSNQDTRGAPYRWTNYRHCGSFDLKANVRQTSVMPTTQPEPTILAMGCCTEAMCGESPMRLQRKKFAAQNKTCPVRDLNSVAAPENSFTGGATVPKTLRSHCVQIIFPEPLHPLRVHYVSMITTAECVTRSTPVRGPWHLGCSSLSVTRNPRMPHSSFCSQVAFCGGYAECS